MHNNLSKIKINQRLSPVLAILLLLSATTATGVGNDKAKLRSGDVTMVVIHAIGGPMCKGDKVVFTGAPGNAKKWIKYFENHDEVSIHYVVDRQGNVEAGIDEDRIAWHVYGSNSRSIGIELVNRGDGQEEYPTEQVAALVELVKKIKNRHPGIAKIVRHSDVDQRTKPCGGKEFNRKQDPGPKFPFEAFLASVASD